jgi:hypothetical protein
MNRPVRAYNRKREWTGLMKRGAKPLGERAMTAAERQARFRIAHADGTPRLRYRRPTDRRSRAQRWRDAVVELVTLQDDYRAWLDSLHLQAGATAEALRAICDLDLSDLSSVEPPRSFGRGSWRRSGASRKPGDHTRNDEPKSPGALPFVLPAG